MGKKELNKIENFVFDKTRVYIGDTPYHLLIAIVKTILSHRVGKDIFVGLHQHYSPDILQNAKKIFKDTRSDYTRIGVLVNILCFKFKQKIPFLKTKNCPLKQFFSGKEIFIFDDKFYLGCWLNNTKTFYTLIEDGLNCYKFAEHIKLKTKVYEFFFKILGISWNYWGKSKYTKAVEVNENKDLRFNHKNIIERNRAEMFNKLSREEINLIASIFNYHPLKKQVDGEKTLLLTQPLSEDRDVSHTTKINIYKYRVKKYAIGTLYIKMHPREKEDYTNVFPNAIILANQNLPFELIQLKENFHFKRVITTFSTAIDAVFCADEKISMTPEWVRSFKKRSSEGFS